MSKVWMECIDCHRRYDEGTVVYRCDCGGLLEVKMEIPRLGEAGWDLFRRRDLGVWRYRELLPIDFGLDIVTLKEGGTPLYKCDRLARWLGIDNLYLKYEGANPTGSFKDRGMTVGVTKALRLRARAVACASTGNTAASLAAYSARAGLPCMVIVPRAGTALGKLFQAIMYGANVVMLDGNFDEAFKLVYDAAMKTGTYLLNSINPWRLEGQKTGAFEIVDQLDYVPDYVVVPVGNCGNIAAYWKGFKEIVESGLARRSPKMVGVQAEGASPFYEMVTSGRDEPIPVKDPRTIASAIRIGMPVNWKKALLAIRESSGIVSKVSDNEILEAQRMVARLEGVGVEPAAAASIAGARKLLEQGLMNRDSTVVCVCTGSLLKDPNPDLIKDLKVYEAKPDFNEILNILRSIIGTDG